MICSVLCVGTELLLGQIDDTNSTFIGEHLSRAGILSYEHRRVGDNPERIAHAMTDMLFSADALIVTGGLGPTHDDITREVTADVMGVELKLDEEIVAEMKEFFAQRNRTMSDNNMRQAMVPVGATPLKNPLGTAPGLLCPVIVGGKEKTIYLTPGVPYEMKYMMTHYVIPDLISHEKNPNAIVTRTIKTWGLPESVLAETLNDLVIDGESGEVMVGFLARGINGINVKLSTTAPTREEALAKITPVENKVVELLGDAIYAFDDDTMESVVVDLLISQGKTLAIAESLTGGMVSSRLVEIAGVSETLLGAVVSYATSVKHGTLNVTVDDVYSHDCAQQMAAGVREQLSSTLGLSTTGVAGPDPDGGHPAGEVYIGISDEHGSFSNEFHLSGDRIRVREYATMTALDMLRKYLITLRNGPGEPS